MVVSIVWIYDTCVGDQCLSAFDFPPLISSLGTTVVISCLSGRPKMWATAALQNQIRELLYPDRSAHRHLDLR